MSLFSLSASSSSPGHFGMDVAGKTSQLMGRRGAMLTNLFMVLYAIFFDIKILTKTMAMLFMAFFAMLFKPVAALTKVIKPALKYLILVHMRWKLLRKYLWRNLVTAGNAVGLHRIFARKSKYQQIESPFKDPLEKHQIRLEGMLDETANKVAYAFLALFWGMTIWVLLALGMQIRLIMGPDAEMDLIKAWAMTFLFEQFGIKALKLMMVRSTGRYVSGQYDKLMTGKELFDILLWYERYATDFELAYFPMEEDADAFFGNVML
ncbi:hypothetical protein CYMTET_27162 [Cymbomonas tetramitiformis]|uniref:Uncharacterized protein n=1 Tax=Cymbomonas tetramitiformis TaxID=36881 RepID=A0AAE0FQA8_9CHLO|nr:hypothetical protein CYMTET_27162 [Cymbomonas tetramitiformis]